MTGRASEGQTRGDDTDSNLPDPHIADLVVGTLMQDRGSPAAGGQHVLHQVRAVDGVPDLLSDGDGLVVGHSCVLTEERVGVGERGLSQGEEPVDVPPDDVGLLSIDVYREVEEVAQGEPDGAVAA